MLQYEVDEFEETKQGHDLLVVAIASVGCGFSPQTVKKHRKKAINESWRPRDDSADGTHYYAQYMLLKDKTVPWPMDKEFINLNEYCSRLASGSSTHVI